MCSQGRSFGTIHDTSAYARSEFNARCHYKSARKVSRRKEKERTERRAEKDRAKWFYLTMPRCLISQKKIMALESDPRLWKLFAATPLPFFCWLSPGISTLDDRFQESSWPENYTRGRAKFRWCATRLHCMP